MICVRDTLGPMLHLVQILAMLKISCHGSIPVAAWPNCCCSIFKHISKSWFLLEYKASGNGLDSLIVVWQQVVEPDEDLCSFLHPMIQQWLDILVTLQNCTYMPNVCMHAECVLPSDPERADATLLMRCGPLNIRANETFHTLLNFSQYSSKLYLELSVLGAVRTPGIHPKWLCVPLSPLKAAAGASKFHLLDQDSNPNTCMAT